MLLNKHAGIQRITLAMKMAADTQKTQCLDGLPALPDDPTWQLVEPGIVPALEHDIETRFTIGNGLLGVRGSLEEGYAWSRARTFVAGLFDLTTTEPPVPALVAGPDWVRLRLLIDGEPLDLESGRIVRHTRMLDFRRGTLIRDWRQLDPAGQIVHVHTLRFASLADRALAVQLAQLTVAQSTNVTLQAWLEPSDERLMLVYMTPQQTLWRTAHTGKYLAVAAAHTLRVAERTIRAQPDSDGGWRWTWAATPDQPADFTRFVAFARGMEPEDVATTAQTALHQARRSGRQRVFTSHAQTWSNRWQASDVAVEGDDMAQRALRFAGYHLITVANPGDEHVSIGARALSGDAYLGHVFWDTEIFLVPFYTVTWPAAARALLMYRYRTLRAARGKAARMGYRGALYAWESADSGEEATPPWVRGPDGQIIEVRSGIDEQHISADVAHAVWQYWQATRDDQFFREAGAEIVLETARFWASRAVLEADGRYHIRHVVGPDEYHEDVDDNAFTNGMAQWNIERGLELVDLLQARWPDRWATLRNQLELTTDELDTWRDVADRIVTGFDPPTGLYEQFAGYFGLEPIDLRQYPNRTAPMDLVLGRERTQRSQVIKQADVVMLLALLWDRYPPEVRAANFRYYEARTGHGSSLSPAMHALVAARLGDTALALRYFHQAAAIDLDDTMGNAALGVHIATLGGLWQAAVRGFGGISVGSDGLSCDPHLPASWRSLRFAVQWRGRRVRFRITSDPLHVTATLERGQPLVVMVGDRHHNMKPAQSWTWRYDQKQQAWQEAMQ